MDQDTLPAGRFVSGSDLNNYFLYKRDPNCFVFIHKKYICNHGANTKKAEVKLENRKRHLSPVVNKRDTYDTKPTNHNGSVLKQTIQFAKSLIPLTIPPSRDKSPVYYTVKASKKKARKEFSQEQDILRDRERSKPVTKTNRKNKTNIHRQNVRVVDSASVSSASNTFDHVNINHSLSGTMSELSEKKELRKELKRNNSNKFIISDSFEAVAANKVSEGGGIKIHLMNEADTKTLTDAIRIPILNTVQDCLKQINSRGIKSNLCGVERCISANTSKLDLIIEKLARLEKKLEDLIDDKNLPVKQAKANVSKLERLGQDVHEENGIACSDEESQYPTDGDSKSNAVEYLTKANTMSKLGCGETGMGKSFSSIGVKTDLASRLPTRFCWTDTTVVKNID